MNLLDPAVLPWFSNTFHNKRFKISKWYRTIRYGSIQCVIGFLVDNWVSMDTNNTGQTRTNHWNFPSIPWWLTCIKTSKPKSLRRFKYTVHPLFKALYRYTRLKYKTKEGKTGNSGVLDRIERKYLVCFSPKLS
jgi:hypothetical protein